MPRAYYGEPAIQDYFNQLVQRKVDAEVGLLVGKEAVGSRDLILSTVSTPTQDGSAAIQCSGPAAAAAKGKKPTQTATLNTDWIVQHAEQCARMLPGGLSLLGVYVYGPDAVYQSVLPQLTTVLTELQRLRSTAGTTGRDLAVLHADVSRKVTARSAPVTPGFAINTLSVCELKWVTSEGSLALIQARWPLQCSLPAPTDSQSLQTLLDRLVGEQRQRIRDAVVALPGQALPALDTALTDIPLPAPATGPYGPPVSTVQLLALQGSGLGGEAGSANASVRVESVGGRGQLGGWLQGVAVVHKRQTWASAVQELKDDLCHSLRVRVDLLIEDALSWQQEAEDSAAQPDGSAAPGPAAAAAAAAKQHPLLSSSQPVARPYAAALPRRVAVKALRGLTVCDYLLDGESAQDAAGRVSDLLGAGEEQALQGQVTELERAPTVPTKLSPWSPWATQTATVAGQAVSKTSAKRAAGGEGCTEILGGLAVGVALALGVLAVFMSGLVK